MLAGDEHGDDVQAGGSLWEAVKIVAIADIVMSLDNVLAIAGAAESAPADQRLMLIILGLVISIPLVVAGATLIVRLLNRYPIFVWLGAALLGWIAGELIATEPMLKTYLEQFDGQYLGGIGEKGVKHLLEAGSVVIVLVFGWLLKKLKGGAKAVGH